MNAIYMLNLVSVGLFGMILSASFCDIVWAQSKYRFIAGGTIAIFLFQGIIFYANGLTAVHYFYPVVTHLPLAIILCVLGKDAIWSFVAVLTAYLCCQLRRWIALLIVAVFSGGTLMQNAAELILTLPILLFLLRFISPSVRSISHSTALQKYQFGLVPALYYVFDYTTRVYTNILSGDNQVILEFMPFLCSLTYLIFVIIVSKKESLLAQSEQTQNSLNLQVSQAVREIMLLRESQRKADTYRHDLRHHMQYLYSCIESGRIEQAKGYIAEIFSEIETNKVINFCENEAANLIFSAFAGRAKEQGILFKVQAAIPQILPVSESDLCVLLSNALENALHSCRKLKGSGQNTAIEVLAYEKKDRFFLQIVNSCDNNVEFSQGIPITDKIAHGIGVRSICAIAEKYNGMYNFSADNGQFILRISLYTPVSGVSRQLM